jgi:hypothetical protein
MIHAKSATAANGLPMMEVGRFGSMICSLVSVARQGAVKYSRKMKNSDHPTDLRAARTDGVVKYRIRMCGRDAVPVIMHSASVKNFQLSNGAPVALIGVVRIRRPLNDSVALSPRCMAGCSS